jgi:hypothetical protein
MGRATELIALSNMTSDERKRFAYGNNAATYFTHITIDTELLKKVMPKGYAAKYLAEQREKERPPIMKRRPKDDHLDIEHYE